MKRLFCTIITTLFVMIVLTTVSQAQIILKPSTADDVALLFYKTGDALPDFSKWVRQSSDYRHTPWARKEDKLARDIQEWMRRYQAVNVKDDLIRIQTPVTLDLQEFEKGDQLYHLLSLKFTKAKNADYFPYPLFDQLIAVVPTNLRAYRNNLISKATYNKLNQYKATARQNALPVLIELQAQHADHTQPYDLDGVDQWIFKTKIVTFTVYDHQNNILWDKMDESYTSPITEDLNALYDAQYEQEPDYIQP